LINRQSDFVHFRASFRVRVGDQRETPMLLTNPDTLGKEDPMAELALQLPVFIASPSDVLEERDKVEAEVRKRGADVAPKGLLLRPIRWELDSRPGMVRPQHAINELLKSAELAVVIFWSTLGSESAPGTEDSGTLEELFRATDQVIRGASDDVLVYFRNAPPPVGSEIAHARVQAFRGRLQASKSVFFESYETPDDFGTKFARHFNQWIERWNPVPDICVNTLTVSSPGVSGIEHSGANLLGEIHRFFRPENEPELTRQLGRAAVALYQEYGPRGVQEPISLTSSATRVASRYVGSGDDYAAIALMRLLGRLHVSPSPLRYDGTAYRFADEGWFSYFCALGLVTAIREGRIDAVDKQPYVNLVHQYLAAVAVPQKSELVPNLIRWLRNDDMISYARPVARNFAAYVLGMLDAEDAEDALIESAEHDTGTDVRLYSTMSLGRMRSRRHLDRLVKLWRRETDPRFRVTLGQAVCRIVGIAEFPF
jgi:hypothetical protein